jgi:Tfp pilus assembly protein PilE
MDINTRKTQRGITLIGLIFVGLIVAFLVVIGMKVLPTVTEYFTIVKAVKKAANESTTVLEVRVSFERTIAVDYISAISSKDLEITKQGDKIVVKFAYDKEIELLDPVYLTIKYRGSSTGSNN